MISNKSANKSLKQDKKQLAFAPSSLILANYFFPLIWALAFTHWVALYDK